MNHKIVYGGKQSTKHGVLAVWFTIIYHGEIHMSKKVHHYVYQITNLITNKKYIGKRSSKIPPNNDLGKKYFSSSYDKNFITEQKSNPSNFKYEILKEFNTANDAVAYEVHLHQLHDVGTNPEFYNQVKQTSKFFDPTGKVTVRDKDGNCINVDKDDPRYLSGMLVSAIVGKVSVKDKNGNHFLIDKNDSRYLSGELIHNCSDTVMTKDNHGNYIRVAKTDPRYLSRELVGSTKGKVPVKDKNGKHFLIDKNDPLYLSNDLVHATSGRRCDDHVRLRVSEAQSGSGNSQYGTCWIHNLELKKCKKIKKDDLVPKGWVVGRKMRFD